MLMPPHSFSRRPPHTSHTPTPEQYTRAGELLHSKIPSLQRQLESQSAAVDEQQSMLGNAVTKDHVAEVVANTTGTPLE